MIILGIDPGLAIIGYGVIKTDGTHSKLLEYGAIRTKPSDNTPMRLSVIYNNLITIIDEYKPDEVAIEELFFNKNIKTAMAVSQARGVAILACKNKGLDIYEYTPLQVKQGVTGYGRAEKGAVQEMVKMLLNLKEIPKPDDAADALALTLCHSATLTFKEEFIMK